MASVSDTNAEQPGAEAPPRPRPKSLTIGARYNHVLRKEFKRDGPLEFQVGRFINDTHATRTQLLGDSVVRDGLPEHGGANLQRVDVAEILG